MGAEATEHCGACGQYMPLTLDGSRRVHECDRTPPLDGLPPTLYACPTCGGHGASRWGCRGTKARPHELAYMRPVHELVRALDRAAGALRWSSSSQAQAAEALARRAQGRDVPHV